MVGAAGRRRALKRSRQPVLAVRSVPSPNVLILAQVGKGDAVRTRTIEEIEQAFREMGLTELTWGRPPEPSIEPVAERVPAMQTFIRIETSTTPLKEKSDADVA